LRCYIVESYMGFFAYNDDLKLIKWRPFPSPEEAVDQLSVLERTGSSSDLEILIHDLKEMGFDEFVFEDEQEGKVAKAKHGISSSVTYPSDGGRVFRASIANAAAAAGIKPKAKDKFMKEVAEALARLKVKSASEKRDRLVAQAVSALDELDKNVNISTSRVREWYGLHFPELDALVPDHKQYMNIVVQLGDRSGFDLGRVEAIVQSENKSKAIVEMAQKSMGASISPNDMEKIISLASVNLKVYDERDAIEKYIDDTMKEVAPNVREIVGASLGARLIALAGSLENLAKKPASTIQVLGAEKALFRSLKTGARPPKHGIIFQHQYLHSAERWQRGKIARALAGKLSIAARVDAFGGQDVSSKLKESLEKRVAEIKKKYSKPPIRPQRREFQQRQKFGRGDRFNRDRDRWGKKQRFDKKWRGNKRW